MTFRDITPQNVISKVEDGSETIKLIDFNAAKEFEGEEAFLLTQTGH